MSQGSFLLDSGSFWSWVTCRLTHFEVFVGCREGLALALGDDLKQLADFVGLEEDREEHDQLVVAHLALLLQLLEVLGAAEENVFDHLDARRHRVNELLQLRRPPNDQFQLIPLLIAIFPFERFVLYDLDDFRALSRHFVEICQHLVSVRVLLGDQLVPDRLPELDVCDFALVDFKAEVLAVPEGPKVVEDRRFLVDGRVEVELQELFFLDEAVVIGVVVAEEVFDSVVVFVADAEVCRFGDELGHLLAAHEPPGRKAIEHFFEGGLRFFGEFAITTIKNRPK